jgi:hypothetical protein
MFTNKDYRTHNFIMMKNILGTGAKQETEQIKQ